MPLVRRQGRVSVRRMRALMGVFLVLLLTSGIGGIAATGPAAAFAAQKPPSQSVTITGTASGDHAWNPTTEKQYAAAPSVTIDQNSDLTDQVVHVTWKNFTPSVDNAGRFFSQGITYYAVTVLECKGLHPKDPTLWRWPDFGPDCYNFTADNANAAHGTGNQAYTLTGPNGEGETYFHVESGVENDFLGCDETHPCSLVVVPNWGGVQPPGDAVGNKAVKCADHDYDESFIFGNYALDSGLGQACSWSDRITVPLHFAPTPSNCPDHQYSFAAEGAPILSRTFDQWRSAWCRGKSPITFDFDSGTDEYLARQTFLTGSGALTSSVDLAVVNQPADSVAPGGRKFTYAPLTNSALSIAFHIDDLQTGKLITHLTLDARLVAKLITQSYSLAFGCAQGGNTHKQGPTCDPAVKGNPVDIFDDPEFLKLNPDYTRADFPATNLLDRGQFLPLVVSGNSDVTHELTAWIHADPEARKFLKGTPDQWGMHVNTYYKNEPLPTDLFQNLDPGYTAPASNKVPGQSTMQVTWNPLSGMDNVAESLVVDRPSGINPTLPPCGVSGVPCVYQRFGSETPGQRALFAVVGSVDAAADRFPSAALVNAAGKAVAPTNAALRAAVNGMVTDKRNGITQSANFASKAAGQYALPMTDYAMVPTCGLSAKKVAAIRTFLTLARTSQHVGLLPGDLAPGSLPLTKKQLKQTAAAAKLVSDAKCTTPHPHPTHSASPPPAAQGSGPQGGFSSQPAPSSSQPSSSAAPTKTSTSAAPTSSSPSPAPSTTPAAFGIKPSDSTIGTGFVLPLALLLGLLLFVGGPVAFFALSGGGGAALATRVRGLRKGLHR